MNIPLHLNPNDNSAEANLARIAHHTTMFRLSGGRGFRHNTKAATRIERLGQASFADDTSVAPRQSRARPLRRKVGWVPCGL